MKALALPPHREDRWGIGRIGRIGLIRPILLAAGHERLHQKLIHVTPWVDPIRTLLYSATMAARPIQISIDSDLLDQIDTDPEVREKGRSAFIRSAVQLYLKAKERLEIETRLSQAYGGQADSLLEEVEALMGKQAWPKD